MCGITGFKIFKEGQSDFFDSLERSMKNLGLRGPDASGTYKHNNVGLGHTRLSIIDTSSKGNQPMSDPSGRYTLIFNGEIYNFLSLKKDVSGTDFQSTTDTEVLLHLLIKEGEKCLTKLNGFFALAFYDKEEDRLLLARDRMGIKPLIYYQDDHQFVFGSEMKALLSFPLPKRLDNESLYWYLKLNYLPSTKSMLQGFHKLEPGHCIIIIGNNSIKNKRYITNDRSVYREDYQSSQTKLIKLLESSVKRRLMSDVPLGAFLSGGTDSSAVVALASRHHSNLSTFSIGYKDHPFFDETHYAELVANKFKTNHTVFSLTNDDLLMDLDSILNYIDEPFADSSAIPTYILSKNVSKHVKVALSGDGADELFGGYYKHAALRQSLNGSGIHALIKALNPIVSALPQSRSGKLSNLVRRMNRYGKMLKLDPHERYWFLASLLNDPSSLLKSEIDEDSIQNLKRELLNKAESLNDYLKLDQKLVLPNDMLTKVDLMSMANSLEVRVPFLDTEVVDFANSLPDSYKVTGAKRKMILQDAFREILPPELYNRPKKGFEIPLLQWMRNELLSDLDQHLFNRDLLNEQEIFVTENVMKLRKTLISQNPGDVHGPIWALFVFQKWYLKTLN